MSYWGKRGAEHLHQGSLSIPLLSRLDPCRPPLLPAVVSQLRVLLLNVDRNHESAKHSSVSGSRI